ncbi:MAG: glycosyltransferase family 1 protein [bacterium]
MTDSQEKTAIGIDASPVCNATPTGIARYTKNLIDSLLARPEMGTQFEIDLLYRLSRFKKRDLRYLPDNSNVHWFLGNSLFRNRKYEIVHSTDTTVVDWKRTIKMATVYDLTIFIKENKKHIRTSKSFYDIKWEKMKNCAKRADAIIVISQSTKSDFLKFFNFHENNIFTVYPGIEPIYFDNNKPLLDRDELKTLFKIKREYLLFVGVISYRKNCLGLIQAYYQSGTYKDYDLVLAGGTGPGMDNIIGLIDKLGLKEHVILTGYVPDSVLPSLYNMAKAFVFPTFYEGFGIPIIEAMLCRTPVMIGNKGSAPEISDGLAVQVNPCDTDSIAEGIKRVLQVDNEQIEKAYHHARQFTWESSAGQILNIYRTLGDV